MSEEFSVYEFLDKNNNVIEHRMKTYKMLSNTPAPNNEKKFPFNLCDMDCDMKEIETASKKDYKMVNIGGKESGVFIFSS